mmetsp:Transcript_90838/g.196529  ORF Transcript_90838/g.196529 Transcript_90838/m.196529 type:complete len:256 (+) Transcript_90838:871-1638(+)
MAHLAGGCGDAQAVALRRDRHRGERRAEQGGEAESGRALPCRRGPLDRGVQHGQLGHDRLRGDGQQHAPGGLARDPDRRAGGARRNGQRLPGDGEPDRRAPAAEARMGPLPAPVGRGVPERHVRPGQVRRAAVPALPEGQGRRGGGLPEPAAGHHRGRHAERPRGRERRLARAGGHPGASGRLERRPWGTSGRPPIAETAPKCATRPIIRIEVGRATDGPAPRLTMTPPAASCTLARTVRVCYDSTSAARCVLDN